MVETRGASTAKPEPKDLATAKAELRMRAKKARAVLDPAVRARKSHEICDEAAALLDVRAAACETSLLEGNLSEGSPFTLALYAALRDEVSLDKLATHAFARGWRLCFPAMVRRAGDGAGAEMAFFVVGRASYEAQEAPFVSCPSRVFLLEDLKGQGFVEVAPSHMDAVVVPLVAFDGRGGRLGSGGGNYDRYLPRLRSDALVVGVAFKEQRVARVPTEDHDLILPSILTA